MTKIPQNPKKWPKYFRNLKNDQNTLKTKKMTKIPSKSKSYQNSKNDQNDLETYEGTKKPNTQNLKNDQNISKT